MVKRSRSTLTLTRYKLRQFLSAIAYITIIVLLQGITNYWLRIAGMLLVAVGSILLITRLAYDRRKLLELATLDELTGLGNFKAYKERIRCESQRALRKQSPLALILVDLDRFKNFNDTYGHRAGNELLHSAGQVFREAVRSMDGIYRFGGDEFAFVLPETNYEDAQLIAKRIRQSFERIPNRGKVTLSMGMAIYRDEPIERFFDRVDHLLYTVKANGGNCCLIESSGNFQRIDSYWAYQKAKV